jgi:hypothetical protein
VKKRREATGIMSTDRIVRRVTDFKAQREETYHYWRSRTIAERIEAVAELVRDAYFAKRR